MNLKRNGAWAVRLALVALAGALLLVPQGTRTHAQNHVRVSMTTDWSNRHVVFSAPSNIWQSWQLQKEPRYWQQLLRRNADAWRNAAALRGAQ